MKRLDERHEMEPLGRQVFSQRIQMSFVFLSLWLQAQYYAKWAISINKKNDCPMRQYIYVSPAGLVRKSAQFSKQESSPVLVLSRCCSSDLLTHWAVLRLAYGLPVHGCKVRFSQVNCKGSFNLLRLHVLLLRGRVYVVNTPGVEGTDGFLEALNAKNVCQNERHTHTCWYK